MRAKKEHFKEVNALLESAEFPQAIEQMQSWSQVSLIQFLQVHPQNYELLRHEDFDGFWEKRRTQLDSRFSFAKQKNLSDMDLVLGYLFYLMANREKAQGNESQYGQYLEAALACHSIHAAQSFLHKQMVEKPNEKLRQMEKIAATLYHWKSLAAQHGTPGYLLLASGYQHLLQLSGEEKKSEFYDNAGFCLWYNLVLAELYESESEASIQNAYFGKGLILSNSFNLCTISAMKEKIPPLMVDEATRALAASRARHFFAASDDYKIGLWLKSRNSEKRSDMASFHHVPKI